MGTLSREDLQDLFPGPENFLRRKAVWRACQDVLEVSFSVTHHHLKLASSCFCPITTSLTVGRVEWLFTIPPFTHTHTQKLRFAFIHYYLFYRNLAKMTQNLQPAPPLMSHPSNRHPLL